MSKKIEKEITDARINELLSNTSTGTKKLIHIVSTSGAESKSTIACAIADAFERRSIPLAKLDADKDHKSFFNTYGQRNASGELLPKDEQDAVKGCKLIDINTEHQEIANLVASPADYYLIDFRAAGIDEIPQIFGEMSQYIMFLDSLGIDGEYIIPICTDKSFKSIYALYELLSRVENPTRKFKITLVINKGLMDVKKSKATVADMLVNDPAIQLIKNNENFQLNQIAIETKFTPNIIELLKSNKISVASQIALHKPFDNFIMNMLKMDGDTLFNAIK